MARFMLANIPVLLQLYCTPYKGVELNSKKDTSPKLDFFNPLRSEAKREFCHETSKLNQHLVRTSE